MTSNSRGRQQGTLPATKRSRVHELQDPKGAEFQSRTSVVFLATNQMRSCLSLIGHSWGKARDGAQDAIQEGLLVLEQSPDHSQHPTGDGTKLPPTHCLKMLDFYGPNSHKVGGRPVSEALGGALGPGARL